MSNDNGESDVSPTKPPDHTHGLTKTFLAGTGKGRCHHLDIHVAGKSDSLVVPEKQANKSEPQTAAESVEERRLTEENASQSLLVHAGKNGDRHRGRSQSPFLPGRLFVESLNREDQGARKNGDRVRGRSQWSRLRIAEERGQRRS